jgi:hypothetical protein
MSKLITASINLKKVDQSLLIPGEKGKYLNLTIWINDEPDKYGNDVSLEQRTEKGKDKIYLGNGRSYKKDEQSVSTAVISDEIDDIFK